MVDKRLKGLYYHIMNSYHTEKYEDVLKLFEFYLKQRHAAIDERLLNVYSNSLERLGYFEQAMESYKIYDSFYESNYTKRKIARMAVQLKKTEEAIDFLNQSLKLNFNDFDTHYILGRVYLHCNQLQKAKEHFKFCLDSKKEKQVIDSRRNLSQIDNYEKNGIFVETDYDVFQNLGHKLEPGYVICINNEVKIINTFQVNNDAKSKSRTYLVWKVEKDNVYCFPLSTKINFEKDVVLDKEESPYLGYSVTIKDNLCCIPHFDIYRIIGRISENKYFAFMKSVYFSTYYGKNLEEKEGKKIFLEEMKPYFSKKSHSEKVYLKK